MTTEDKLFHFKDAIRASMIEISSDREESNLDAPEGFKIYISKETMGYRVIPVDAKLKKSEEKKLDKLYELVSIETL